MGTCTSRLPVLDDLALMLKKINLLSIINITDSILQSHNEYYLISMNCNFKLAIS